MYLRTDLASSQASSYFQQAAQALQVATAQIASGTPLISASVNPADSAISAAMQAQVDNLAAGYENTRTSVGMLNTASGAMAQIQGLLQDLYKTATQAANGANNLQDRIDMQQQMNQYTQAIADLTNQTQYNGLPLLAGVLGQTNVDVGQQGKISFSLPALDPVSLGIAGNIPTAILDNGWYTGGGYNAASYIQSVIPLGNFGSGALVDRRYSIALISAQLDMAQGQGYQEYVSGSGTTKVTGQVTLNPDGNGGWLETGGTWVQTVGVLTPVSSTAASTHGAWAPLNFYYAGLTPGTYLFRATTNGAGTGLASFEFSKDGGSTWISLPIPGNPGIAGNGSLNLVTGTSMGFSNPNFIGMGVGKQLSPGTPPSIYGTSPGLGLDPNSTPGATDTYQLTFTPAEYTYQLQNEQGQGIGAPVTLVGGQAVSIPGQSTSPSSMILGDMATGEAVQVNLGPQPLWQSGWWFNSGFNMMSGQLQTGPGIGPWGQYLYLSASNQVAQGGNGAITQPAQVSSGLSVLGYQAATVAQQKILQAMRMVSQAQGKVGAVTDRLDTAGTVSQVEKGNTVSALTGIADVQVAKATTALAADQAREQVTAAMLATSERMPRWILRLWSPTKLP